jgi:hypothetical protein
VTGCHEPEGQTSSCSALPATNAKSVERFGSRWKERDVMEVIHPRCAGIDLSKKDAKVCVTHRSLAPTNHWASP